MRLVNVYSVLDSTDVLYRLLTEREDNQNISHRGMPSIAEHVRFIASNLYEAWYLVETDYKTVGAIYLTRQDEIGIFIFKEHQGQRYGPAAIRLLIEAHPRSRYLANINPANEQSIRMFGRFGFAHIQNTYELQP